MYKIFLVTALLSVTLAKSLEEGHADSMKLQDRKHKKTRPEDLVPSNHGIETKNSNRDFTNMIQYGLIEGMFKVKMSGLPDCTDEGMTFWRAAGRMTLKMNEGIETTDEDVLNLF